MNKDYEQALQLLETAIDLTDQLREEPDTDLAEQVYSLITEVSDLLNGEYATVNEAD